MKWDSLRCLTDILLRGAVLVYQFIDPRQFTTDVFACMIVKIIPSNEPKILRVLA